MTINLMRVDLVDLMRVDLVAIDLMRIDLVIPSLFFGFLECVHTGAKLMHSSHKFICEATGGTRTLVHSLVVKALVHKSYPVLYIQAAKYVTPTFSISKQLSACFLKIL